LVPLRLGRQCLHLSQIRPRRDFLDRRPNAIDRLYDLLWQWPLVANFQVLLQLRNAAGADDDGITMLARQSGVVNAPTQSGGMSCEAVFLCRILNLLRRLEDGIFMVACYRASVYRTRNFQWHHYG